RFLLTAFFVTLFGGLLAITLRMFIRSVRRDRITTITLVCLWSVAGIVALVLSAPVYFLGALPVTLIGAIGILAAYARFRQRELADLVACSHPMRQFGLANFDRLDGDHNGVICMGDLIAIENDPSVNADDRNIIREMRRWLPRVGHPIDYTVIIGSFGGPATPVYHYGISRADLETFPDRAQAEFDEEFKGRYARSTQQRLRPAAWLDAGERLDDSHNRS